ncbi:hypothetical protein CY35_13G035400 [Sphagnum magellanicum]|jgi:hypothetical protein|nr:hypothetical protein CY35_13G035400 [Sphagnum magellanicum]
MGQLLSATLVMLLVFVANNGMQQTEAQGVTRPYVRPPARKNLELEFSLRQTSTSSATSPTQMHVSLAGPNKMKVSWMTGSRTYNVPAIVTYGTAQGQLTQVATGTTKSYNYLLYQSGQMHHVILGPLADSTTYFYMCGGFGPVYNFTTPPPAGRDVPIKFAIVGDLGQTAWSESTLQHVAGYDYDVLLFAGDLSYADYFQQKWDSFGQMMSPYAHYRPWMVTEGNHEMEYIPLLAPSFRSYNTRWDMPYAESGSTSNLYYSFDVASAHVLMLGSYTNFGVGSEQYNWLLADLKKVDRSVTPWLVVVLHAPWYNSNSAHQGDGDQMMEVMEPILYQAKVDILFAGHVHAYERTTRAYQMNIDPCGMMHITVGDGGNHEGLANEWLYPQPEWSMMREASFGHGELDVKNATHAYWSWHRNNDNEAVKADDVWITSLSGPKSGCESSTEFIMN